MLETGSVDGQGWDWKSCQLVGLVGRGVQAATELGLSAERARLEVQGLPVPKGVRERRLQRLFAARLVQEREWTWVKAQERGAAAPEIQLGRA